MSIKKITKLNLVLLLVTTLNGFVEADEVVVSKRNDEISTDLGTVLQGATKDLTIKLDESSSCSSIKGSVTDASEDDGWVGGGEGQSITVTFNAPKDDSGVHTGLVKGKFIGCPGSDGDGGGGTANWNVSAKVNVKREDDCKPATRAVISDSDGRVISVPPTDTLEVVPDKSSEDLSGLISKVKDNVSIQDCYEWETSGKGLKDVTKTGKDVTLEEAAKYYTSDERFLNDVDRKGRVEVQPGVKETLEGQLLVYPSNTSFAQIDFTKASKDVEEDINTVLEYISLASPINIEKLELPKGKYMFENQWKEKSIQKARWTYNLDAKLDPLVGLKASVAALPKKYKKKAEKSVESVVSTYCSDVGVDGRIVVTLKQGYTFDYKRKLNGKDIEVNGTGGAEKISGKLGLSLKCANAIVIEAGGEINSGINQTLNGFGDASSIGVNYQIGFNDIRANGTVELRIFREKIVEESFSTTLTDGRNVSETRIEFATFD